MDFTADLDIFLADFGVPCSYGATNFTALLHQPGSNPAVMEVAMSATDYAITYRTDAVALDGGVAVTVNGTAYTVRSVNKNADGAFSTAQLAT